MTALDQLSAHKKKAGAGAAVALLAAIGVTQTGETPRTCETIADEAGVNIGRGARAFKAGDTATVTLMQNANAILADEFIAKGCVKNAI